MSSQPATFLTPEEYLEIERQAEHKSEYYNGEMFAMAGGSLMHGVIAMNIGGELRQRLKGRGCRVCSADVRLRVTSTGLYTYPDVMLVCGDPQFADNRRDTIQNPVLIFEVLSPSTQDYDRGRKFEHYRTLTSLREYLTVAQDRPHIEQYIRGENQWIFRECGALNQTIQLASIDIALPLSEVYDKVDFNL